MWPLWIILGHYSMYTYFSSVQLLFTCCAVLLYISVALVLALLMLGRASVCLSALLIYLALYFGSVMPHLILQVTPYFLAIELQLLHLLVDCVYHLLPRLFNSSSEWHGSIQSQAEAYSLQLSYDGLLYS